MVNKINITVSIDPDTNDKLDKLARSSRKTRSQLIIEALQLLFKTPGGNTK